MSGMAVRVDEGVPIPELLRAAPHVRAVLDRYGLRGCGGERGPAESLGTFARAHDVPVDRLLAEIRDRLAAGPSPAAPAVDERGARLADAVYRPFFRAGILSCSPWGRPGGPTCWCASPWPGRSRRPGCTR